MGIMDLFKKKSSGNVAKDRLKLALINIMRSSPNIRKVFRITDGWICMPSQIISAMACGQSVAAPIIPGFR